VLDHAPRFDAASAAQLARELYALDATARALTSERDQNFLIEPKIGDRIVLKIANALEDPDVLDAQHHALTHIAPTFLLAPRVVATHTGPLVTDVVAPDGRRHRVWAVTYLAGAPLSTQRHRSTALLEHLGARVGALRRAFTGFDHPAIHRDFYWDLARGRDVIAEHRALVRDAAVGAMIDALVERFDAETAPMLSRLARSPIHNDLNDNNVLVGGGTTLYSQRQQVVGIVDFGDMVHSYAVGELAIAAAYASLDAVDPLAAMAALVRGHHGITALTDDELSALFGLIVLRLCTSVCIAAHQQRQDPANEYLVVDQAAIVRLLGVVARIPFGLAAAVFRGAAGLEPAPTSPRVRAWLGANTATFAPVLDADLRTERCAMLDLSVGSPLVNGDERSNAEPMLTRRIAQVVAATGVRVAVGRYDEPRLLYTAPFFAGAGSYAERRTIHLGLDLFADAGTPVHAPLAGTVHGLGENHVLQDYGPVIILRHETDDGVPFWTLYGHLSRESLQGKSVGQTIARGERFATLGAPDLNVGWTPHLHLQVITDLLGAVHDFPGVAPASQRSAWLSLSPDPNLIVGIPASGFPRASPDKATSLARRRQFVGGNVRVAYRDPVRAARGWQQYLFDDEGRRYIDAYNNVPHVGHCHPRVVRAGQAQMSVLNTNTRYISDTLAEYAERLAATLPDPLSVCMFVNSASEANELALRMARTYTSRRDMIVLEGAYHGHTNALVDLSPYKHEGPGGGGAPDWVHVAPLPDDYRGPYKRADTQVGMKYAAHVANIVESLRRRARGLAGFIAETCPSVGGQIMLPTGYLAEAYRLVREAGGVCIADEVQTGLGRMGTHFWAFAAHSVVPDIVVMGKPLGNGHPMAALVTTRAIADAFDNGMEFFSTFGGNNVSCAVGLAVLDVLRDEKLQAHALAVGKRMLTGLKPLADRFAVVGDVRGSGLFLGVELVKDRTTLAPAPDEAAYVANRMREEGILLGTDGPLHNVVKIRPPMPFGHEDADRLVDVFTRIVADELY
jgi:4-aminobutyrate aminotransferase-like enzyme/Ser/Thr protein kinase RdoA (MazF antagonist)